MNKAMPRTRRISRTTGAIMLITAIVFDAAQAMAKLFIFVGLATIGGAVGAYLGSTFGLTETGAVVGGAIGAVATFTGFGTGAALAVGIVLSWTFSLIFALIGYVTLWYLFASHGVSLSEGTFAGERITWGLMAGLIDITPFINAVPALTAWTARMIYITHKEDKEMDKHTDKAVREGYNTLNTTRMRRPRRQYVQ